MSTSRPTEGPASVKRASLAMAHRVLDVTHGLVGDDETRDDAATRISATISELRDAVRRDPEGSANTLAERLGLVPNDFVREVIHGFETEVANAVAAETREWVSETRPEPPFVDAARIEVRTPGGRVVAGLGFRETDLDAAAYVGFVADEDLPSFLSTRGSRGRRLATWEDVTSAAQPRPEDDTALKVVRDRRERLAAASAPGAGRHSPSGNEGRKRILQAPPEDRASELLDMLDAAREALSGDDERAARATLATLESALGALRVLDSGEEAVRLTGHSRPSAGPR